MLNRNFTAALAVVAMLCTSGAAFAHQMESEHGQWVQGDNGPDHGPNDFRNGPGAGPDGRFGPPLSPEKREMLHKAMESAWQKGEADGKKMYALHLDMSKVLEADKFDKARFLSDYEKIAALHAKAERNKAQAFAAVAGKLTPEERKHAAMMVAGPHHGMMMHHPDGKGWARHDGRGGPAHAGKMGCDMHRGWQGKAGGREHGDGRANSAPENRGDYGHLND